MDFVSLYVVLVATSTEIVFIPVTSGIVAFHDVVPVARTPFTVTLMISFGEEAVPFTVTVGSIIR